MAAPKLKVGSLVCVFRGPNVGLVFTKTTHPKIGSRDTVSTVSKSNLLLY